MFHCRCSEKNRPTVLRVVVVNGVLSLARIYKVITIAVLYTVRYLANAFYRRVFMHC